MSAAAPRGTVSIRPATPADADAISRLLDDLEHPTMPAEAATRLVRWTAETDHRVLLAVRGVRGDGGDDPAEDVLGLVETLPIRFLFFPTPTLRIASLVVSSSARRQGVGRALIAAAESEAARLGARAIELTTAARRTGAHAFYRSMGYEVSTGLRFVKRYE